MRVALVLIALYAVLIAGGLLLNSQRRGASVTDATGTRTVFAPARPVTATPESVAAPAAPVSAVPSPAAPTAPSVSAGPSAPTFTPLPVEPESPGMMDAPQLPSGWKETVTQQEMPVVEVTNETNRSVPIEMIFTGTKGVYRLDCTRPIVFIEIPVGNYQYKLNGAGYARNGMPDQAGSFFCRKYRRYSITLTTVRRYDGTQYENLGD